MKERVGKILVLVNECLLVFYGVILSLLSLCTAICSCTLISQGLDTIMLLYNCYYCHEGLKIVGVSWPEFDFIWFCMKLNHMFVSYIYACDDSCAIVM